MRDSPLLFGLAAVFAGLTTVLLVVAIVTRELFVLGIAAPLAVTTYLFWFQASGKLRERVDAGTYRDAFGQRRRAAEQKAAEGPRGPRSRFGREARRAAEERRRRARAAAAGAGQGGRRQRGQRERRRAPRTTDGPSRNEALDRLDLDSGADQADVRAAYREKVKEVHPDTTGGDEEAFKRVTAAYDRLSEE
ncbi:J domain-containing protein [Haloarchaeobius iranensis]|uniref:DnaJ domain-containing protein n=1 Tax=Haloarchaeobius iranensis TaxID=996166 RepID=A0A1G9YZN2_9EURY|nr:J domain-containing protein [Haloarchaeobius iranensis]SDN14387.1 DnaJ domain-containing protein [Haloarchaeobius iranensis]